MFISWTSWHGRSASLAERLDLRPLFLPRRIWKLPFVLRHPLSFFWMVFHLLRHRPRVVAVMSPPPLAVWTAALYGRATGAFVLFDFHSGTFNDPKWRWATGSVLSSARRGLALVTNQRHLEICSNRGVPVELVHDLVIDVPDGGASAPDPPASDAVLVIASHANDEPMDVVLDAAALLPSREFNITGSAAPDFARRAGRLPNVRLTGFVDAATYADLVREASLLICLTTREDTMQRGGYEALAYGKPLVTSRTTVLKEFFGSAACFAGPNAAELAAAIELAMDNRPELSAAMVELGRKQRAADDLAIQTIREHVERGAGRRHPAKQES